MTTYLLKCRGTNESAVRQAIGEVVSTFRKVEDEEVRYIIEAGKQVTEH